MTAFWQNDPISQPSDAASNGEAWWKNDPVAVGQNTKSIAASAEKTETHQSQGVLDKVLEPITSIPSTYVSMVRGAEDTMRQGAGQVGQGLHEIGAGDFRKGFEDAGIGAGRAALGTADYVSSPISAPVHTLFGEPTRKAVTDLTGNQKLGDVAGNTAELGASLFLPVPGSIGREAIVAKSAIPTVDELKTAAKAGFKSPEVDKLAIHPAAVQDWKDQLTTQLNSDGIDENLAPKTFAVLRGLDKAPAGSFVSGKNLQSLRRTLGRAAGTPDPTERAAASKAISSLDNFVEGMPQNSVAVLNGDPTKVAQIWADARGNYAAAKRSETVQGKLEAADLQAHSANSGQNIDNATRQRIKDILKSEKLRRGYSGEELRQMYRIVKGTFTGNASRHIGNLLGGGGGMHQALTSGAGALVAGAPGAVLAPSIGYAFKKLGSVITKSEVAKLDELIRGRSPLADQIRGPLTKYSKAGIVFKSSPSPRTLAGLLIASRNLSNNLRDVGVLAPPDQLASAIQPGNQQ